MFIAKMCNLIDMENFVISTLPNIIVITLAEQTHVFPMADSNALPADEILGTCGNIDNFCLDLLIDPPDEDE